MKRHLLILLFIFLNEMRTNYYYRIKTANEGPNKMANTKNRKVENWIISTHVNELKKMKLIRCRAHSFGSEKKERKTSVR